MAVGKTSTARSVLKNGNYQIKMMKIGKKEYPYCYDESKKWVVTGRYDLNECGGLDGRITSGEIMKVYLNRIMREVSPQVIVFEAVMYGCTFKFGEELARLCRGRGYEYIGCVLDPGVESVLQNVYGRNGGKPINETSLINQYVACSKSAKKLREAGIFCEAVNSRKYRLDEMYKIVEKYTG